MGNSGMNAFHTGFLKDPRFQKRCLLAFIILVSLFRIWLLMRANWMPLWEAYYDDQLQVKQAVSIISGDWLGAEYDKLVLAKNPGYPLFLAGCYFLRIPYPIALGLLMCSAAAFFCYSIRKLINRKIFLFLIYAIIIFTPFFQGAYLRIYRNALIPWVSLFVISALISLYLSEKSLKQNMFEASIGMGSLGFFWLLKEDSIWIVPLLLFYVILIAFKILKASDKKKMLLNKGIPVLIILLGIPLSVMIVSSINKSRYGIYTMNDRTQTNISYVMSDLYKIDDGDLGNDMYAWLSHKGLEKAIEYSPTLTEINFKAYYESWAGGPEKNLKGDNVEWALRDAMAYYGYYQDAQDTNACYLKIHNELQEAFNNGNLQVEDGISISAYVNPMQPDDFVESFFISFDALNALGHYNLCTSDYTDIHYMNGVSNDDIEAWEHLLGIEIPKNAEQVGLISNNEIAIRDNANLERSIMRTGHITNIINLVYTVLSYILFPLSLIVMAVLLLSALIRLLRRDKTENDMWKIMFGFGLAGMSNLYIVGLFSRWITRNVYGTVWPLYASSIYLYITIFMVLGVVSLITFIKKRFYKNGVSSK